MVQVAPHVSHTPPGGDGDKAGARLRVLSGWELPDGFTASCDVVVVGSGAGGAVLATILAEAGARVIVLEEGGYFTPQQYGAFRVTECMRNMWREAGMLTAFGVGPTPIIGLSAGKCVGGSSVLTGGVCFRIPSHIHRDWVNDLGLDGMSEKQLQPAYEEVESRMNVAVVPESERSLSTQKFVLGASRLGIPMHPLKRNTVGCEGHSLCNFGCPKGAKMSVDQSYLPRACDTGAQILSRALVTRIHLDGGHARGVIGHFVPQHPKEKKRHFHIHAPLVVVACGTLHTPLLLMQSGIAHGHPALGRHVTLHPAVRVCAMFDDVLNGWDGVLQSVYSDAFAEEGITLVGVYPPMNLLAAGMPGVGAELHRRIERMRHMAVFGGLVHDEGGGSIRRGTGREPVLTYEMAPRDLGRLRDAMTRIGELAFAGGAREVYLPIFGFDPVCSLDELRKARAMPLDPKRIECIAFHPLGSARMANDARRGIVDEDGRVYGLSGVYVADGSILPTSIGVNSQVPIMTIATQIAWRLAERWKRAH